MKSRRAWNSAQRLRTMSIGPLSAATPAAWLTEEGLSELCALHARHGADQLDRPAGVAQPPAGHGEGLRHAVHGERARGELRRHRRERREGPAVEQDVLVHVVADDPDATDGARAPRRARAARRRVYTAPLGLDGELSISHLVCCVIAFSRSSRRSLKPSSGRVGNQTGTPSAKCVMSAYATHDGAGISTSSPGSSVAISALKSTCLPPAPAEMFSGLALEAVLALELGDDRGLQLGRAVDRRVVRLAGVHRAVRRLDHVVGRVEIGLALRQLDDVPSGGAQLARALRRTGRGRRLGARPPVRTRNPIN